MDVSDERLGAWQHLCLPGGGDETELRFGFACHWDADPSATWSGTPWALRAALAERVPVVDLHLGLSPTARRAARLRAARPSAHGVVSPWKQLPSVQRHLAGQLAERAERVDADVVVQIHDIGRTRQPSFVVQDLSYDIVLDALDDGAGEAITRQFPLPRRRYVELRDRQRRVHDAAHGVLAMSEWLATSLVERSCLDPARVHVIHPGSSMTTDGRPARRDRRRHRLLFLGRDFFRKGGDLTVDAVRHLRSGGHRVELTVAGPDRWPYRGDPPPGVRFVGPVPADARQALYDAHDLFVMPSRFEAFGLVFVEAISRALPCIAANHMAMPEIVTPHVTGLLVPPDDVPALAAAIDRALHDEALYVSTHRHARAIAERYSWSGAADAIVDLASRSVAR